MSLPSKVVLAVLGLLGAVLGFALLGWAAGRSMSMFGLPAVVAVVIAIGGYLMLLCLISLSFGRRFGWNVSSRRHTMAPVPGRYMPLTQGQRDAVEMLAERSDHGAYVRNNPDDTIELLKVERGAVRRYIVSRTGEATLAKSRPRNWRYPCSLYLTWGGALSFVLAIVSGVLVDEDVVSFPQVDDSTLPILFVVALLAFGCLVLGDLLTPHPRDYAGPGEWAHIGYIVD